MRRITLILLTCLLALALVGTTIASASIDTNGKGLKGIFGQAGNSNNAFVELWEKDSTNPEWPVVIDGAWGKLKYSLTGDTFEFHLNGHGLEPGFEYALIYYPDPWPGTGLIVFGTDTADEEGNVHIKGSVELVALPIETDENDGTKIWLVLLSDVGEGETGMIAWAPAEYLFEYDLIVFNTEASEAEEVTLTGSDPDKPNKPDKPEKSNNGKGNTK